MAEKKDTIEPIEATFDEVASSMVSPKPKPIVTDRSKMPKAIAEGELEIGDLTLSCAVLDDANNTRVLAQNGFLKAIGRHPFASGGSGSAIDWTAPFLKAKNLKPFVIKD